MTLSAEIDPTGLSLSGEDVIHHERRKAIALLLDVANDPRFALRREELQALAAAVRLGGPQASAWRGVNLHAALAADTVLRLRPRRRRRLATLLRVVATFLLVLPVWRVAGAFEQAAAAYRQLLEADVTQGAGLIQLWTTGFGGTLPASQSLPGVVQSSATLIVTSVLLLVGAKWMSRSADRVDQEDHDRGAARLARAMTSASIVLHARTVQNPAEGVEVLTEATTELLRAQQAAQQALHAVQGATDRLDDSTDLLATGIHAMGKSLGLHTGALQHQISELTQVRASLERLSGLAVAGTQATTNR